MQCARTFLGANLATQVNLNGHSVAISASLAPLLSMRVPVRQWVGVMVVR